MGRGLHVSVEFEITRLAFSLGPDDSFIDIRFSLLVLHCDRRFSLRGLAA